LIRRPLTVRMSNPPHLTSPTRLTEVGVDDRALDLGHDRNPW
jgi:hypothetical protein